MASTVTWHVLDIKGRSIHTSPYFNAFGVRWFFKFYPHGFDRDNYGCVRPGRLSQSLLGLHPSRRRRGAIGVRMSFVLTLSLLFA